MILWEVPWRRLTISIFDVMMSSTVSKNCGKVILSVGSSLSISFRSSFILARNDLRVAESTCTCMVQPSQAGINTGLSIAGPSGARGGGGKLDLFNNYLFSTIIQVCFRKFREEKKKSASGMWKPCTPPSSKQIYTLEVRGPSTLLFSNSLWKSIVDRWRKFSDIVDLSRVRHPLKSYGITLVLQDPGNVLQLLYQQW